MKKNLQDLPNRLLTTDQVSRVKELVTLHSEETIFLSDTYAELTADIAIVEHDGQSVYFAISDDPIYKLGVGCYGFVQLAQNIDTGEWVACKIQQVGKEDEKGKATLHQIATAKMMFEMLGRYHGDCVDKVNKTHYLFQTWLQGNDLFDIIAKPNPEYDPKTSLDNVEPNFVRFMPLAEKLHLAITACQSLKQLFDKGFIHCDIKPENFIWDPTTNRLLLVDFSFAMFIGTQPNARKVFLNNVVGTEGYLAPEIDPNTSYASEYSFKSDIYALGLSFRFLFNYLSRRPIQFQPLAAITKWLKKMCKRNPASRPSIDECICFFQSCRDDLFRKQTLLYQKGLARYKPYRDTYYSPDIRDQHTGKPEPIPTPSAVLSFS